MSAIFGIWHLNSEPVDEQNLEQLQKKLRLYGLDNSSTMIDHNIGLGCCLNAAISQSPADVPVYEDKEMVLVGDAQIYNRTELIAQLTDNKQIATQDLLLAAYKKWGTKCPLYINGDFAFAIWEKHSKQLLIFRDHLGVRPLYYFYNGISFAFATDFRALLSLPFVDRQLDEVQLYAAITNTYHIDAEATFFAQIKRLPQAHIMRVDIQGVVKHRYWSPGKKKLFLATEADYAQAMYELVADAIKIRVANRPKLGTELSGGLDSSVITVMANRELRKENKPLSVASWLVPYEILEKQQDDARERINLVCQQEGLTCKYYDPGIPIAKKFDELLPAGNNGRAFLHEYQYFADQGVKLILTGWGGDEAISHRSNLHALFVNGYWRHFWQEAQLSAQGSSWRLCKKIIANVVFPLFSPYNYFGNPNQGVPDIVNQEFAAKLKKRCPKDILYFKINPVKNLESGGIQSRTEITAWLGTHYNVQHLYPFLDYRVVDFAMSIPRHWFFKHGQERYLYSKAFSGILPAAFSGISPKDDIAASTYIRNTLADNVDSFIPIAQQLRRDLFAKYIDWDKMLAILQSPMLKTDL
ncbi:MAG: asparagine synthase-related protein, partial [Acidaminococcaceae bacterium]